MEKEAIDLRVRQKAEDTLMPIHEWTRVDAGIFHHFRQRWVLAISEVLNDQLLPGDYYALAERQAAAFTPDVLTRNAKNTTEPDDAGMTVSKDQDGNGERDKHLLVADPHVRVKAETDLVFYRRKQSVVAVRHASGDDLVAVVEVVSKGNKVGRKAFGDFVRKAAEFLEHRVHLLILDLQPVTSRDPQGIHGAIWDEVSGQEYVRPADRPLTLAAYESGAGVRAFVEPVKVGDALIDMPLYLEPGRYVAVPLEQTYRLAFDFVPARWRRLLEADEPL